MLSALIQTQAFFEYKQAMKMRVERAVVLVLCDFQGPHRTKEAVALEADTLDFRVARK